MSSSTDRHSTSSIEFLTQSWIVNSYSILFTNVLMSYWNCTGRVLLHFPYTVDWNVNKFRRIGMLCCSLFTCAFGISTAGHVRLMFAVHVCICCVNWHWARFGRCTWYYSSMLLDMRSPGTNDVRMMLYTQSLKCINTHSEMDMNGYWFLIKLSSFPALNIIMVFAGRFCSHLECEDFDLISVVI